MNRTIYRLCPFLAVIDAFLCVFLLFLLGGFDNGDALTAISIVVAIGIVTGFGWMSWISAKELMCAKGCENSLFSVVSDKSIPEQGGDSAVESKDSKSQAAQAGEANNEGSSAKPLIEIHDVSGFKGLSSCKSESLSMADATAWLKACRERGEYPTALPCDGHVFADLRSRPLSNVWIMGDVHGDLQALSAVFAFADKWTAKNAAEPPCFISLGDLFDRGEKSVETVVKFVSEMKAREGKVGWLSGNHDWGFSFDEKRGLFISHTFPNQFTMWLNAFLEDKGIMAFGKEVAHLCGKLPAAAVIPGDVLLVHGGVPHKDLQERITSLSDLENPDMRHDFVWGRFHESLKRKRPSREANCQLGVQDVWDFLSILERVGGIRCKAILRGHDHYAERIRVFDAYAPCIVATLNTCSTLKDGAYSSKPLDFTPPAVVHCFNGALEVFRIGN